MLVAIIIHGLTAAADVDYAGNTNPAKGDAYMAGTGLNSLGEANDIVMLYPQAKANTVIGNEEGCWDWEGLLGENFDTHHGLQVRTVNSMLSSLEYYYNAGWLAPVDTSQNSSTWLATVRAMQGNMSNATGL